MVDTDPDVAPGDTVPELRGSDDRCGSVIATADTPDEALARARAAAARVRITTRPAPAEETPAP